MKDKEWDNREQLQAIQAFAENLANRPDGIISVIGKDIQFGSATDFISLYPDYEVGKHDENYIKLYTHRHGCELFKLIRGG